MELLPTRWRIGGTRWEVVPNAVGGIVDALLVLHERLYGGGSYNPIIGGGQCCLVYWDGTEWWSVRPAPERRTSALAADGRGGIYVASDFLAIDSTPAAHIAHWNSATNQWTPLGNGMNHTITALAVDHQGQLYAGECFLKPVVLRRILWHAGMVRSGRRWASARMGQFRRWRWRRMAGCTQAGNLLPRAVCRRSMSRIGTASSGLRSRRARTGRCTRSPLMHAAC